MYKLGKRSEVLIGMVAVLLAVFAFARGKDDAFEFGLFVSAGILAAILVGIRMFKIVYKNTDAKEELEKDKDGHNL